MTGHTVRAVFVAGVLVSFGAAQETVQEPANSCRQESFVHEPSVKLAEIVAPARLLRDDGACPMDDARCLQGGGLERPWTQLALH